MYEKVIHYTHCPACNSSHISLSLHAKDYTVSNNMYAIYECGNCTLRFTQDVPSLNEIGTYYKSAQYISHTNTSKGLVNKLYHVVRQFTLKQKVDLLKKVSGVAQGSLLDIGAGVGAFAAEAKKSHWQITALEPDADARKIALDQFGITIRPSQDLYHLPHDSFDAITLWHVLEHVHTLQAYVEAFFRLLKKNGVLIIAVPNYTSYDALKYGKYWAAYDVPRHLYHFSPQSMQQLVQKHQMQVVRMLPMPFDSYYVSLLSEQYCRGKQHFLKAFLNGFRSNQKAKSAQEYSSVIYVIKKHDS